MLNPLVSIIIPIYNSETFLEACLESIINQSYRNIEVILIDDGSKDNSSRICEEYIKKDSRFILFKQKNRGVSKARNVGIENANGSYITFVDSDDELTSDSIEVLVRDAIKYGADIVSASKYYVSLSGKETIQRLNSMAEIEEFRDNDLLVLSLEFDRRTTACHAKLFKMDLINDIRFVEGKRINEDGYFIFECGLKCPIFVHHDICLYKYFYRKESATRSFFSEKYFDMLYFSKRKREHINSKFPQFSMLANNMEVSTNLFFLEVLCRTNDIKYKSFENESIRFVKNNYKKYRTKNKHEKKMAWIIYHNLYPIYKVAVRIRNYVKG